HIRYSARRKSGIQNVSGGVDERAMRDSNGMVAPSPEQQVSALFRQAGGGSAERYSPEVFATVHVLTSRSGWSGEYDTGSVGAAGLQCHVADVADQIIDLGAIGEDMEPIVGVEHAGPLRSADKAERIL